MGELEGVEGAIIEGLQKELQVVVCCGAE